MEPVECDARTANSARVAAGLVLAAHDSDWDRQLEILGGMDAYSYEGAYVDAEVAQVIEFLTLIARDLESREDAVPWVRAGVRAGVIEFSVAPGMTVANR